MANWMGVLRVSRRSAWHGECVFALAAKGAHGATVANKNGTELYMARVYLIVKIALMLTIQKQIFLDYAARVYE